MRRKLVAVISVSMLVTLAHPARSGDQPAKPAASSASAARALTSAESAQLGNLRRLAAPDPKYKLSPGVLPVFKVAPKKKEISCGVLVYPPNPNPAAKSQQLYWVNSTGQPIPAGAHIEWKVTGTPATCCKGVTGATQSVFPPNPPSPLYFQSAAPELYPPQPWTRPCKAWVILP